MATGTITRPPHPEGARPAGALTAGARNLSFPAPPQLAAPTDLAPEAVQAITAAINPLIAAAFALYAKTKNFHWRLAGLHFRDYHLQHMARQQRAAIALCDQKGDTPTGNLLQEILDQTERRIWFLYEICQEGRP
jgi:DNA-binding ferritin-like protein